MTSISLVTSILNPPALTESFLTCLGRLRKREEFELVLCVDGDPDLRTLPTIEAFSSQLKPVVQKNDLSIGYGRANNLAADSASGDILIFLNSDVFPTERAITDLAHVLIKDPTIGVAQGLLAYPQNGKVQSCGHIFGPYFNNHALKGRSVQLPIVNRAADRQALTSAFYAIRKSDFSALGGFDSCYLNSTEGMELALRLQLGGKRCRYVPDSRAFHIQGGSGQRVQIEEDQQTALFWSRWHDRITCDLDALLLSQLTKEQRNCPYLGINLSSNMFWNRTLDILELSPDMIAEPIARGKPALLFNVLSPTIQAANRPLLFLTDHFSQISDNLIWFSERVNSDDLILDCHGNAITAHEMLNFSP